MKYVTHNEESICVGGTHKVGQLNADYWEIVNAFGIPELSDDHNSDAEWHIRFDEHDVVAAIYNWKNGPLWGGQPFDMITEWSIGGKTEEAAILVKEVLASKEVSA